MKPEFRNWLALGSALTNELFQGIRPSWLSVLENVTGKLLKDLRKRDAVVWLMLLLACHFFVVLDHSRDRDGE